MTLLKHQISIEIPYPTLKFQGENVISWRKFLDKNPIQFNQTTKLESELNTTGFEQVLSLAFQSKIPRQSMWSLDDLRQEEFDAVLLASKIYKRGVFTTNNTSLNKPSLSSKVFIYDNASKDLLSGHLNKITTSNDLIVVDSHVAKHWKEVFQSKNIFTLEVGEFEKTLDTASIIANKITSSKCTKVVIVGGGVIGDVAGFAAGLKGVKSVYIPTTLLSMVDSSIGGKTGVNHPIWGKNQIGLFHMPEEVHVFPSFMETLPALELKSGIVEAIKHAFLIGDQGLWDSLISIASLEQWKNLPDLLGKIIQVKADIVSRDPFEQGERALLNFGHTLGHALEAWALKHNTQLTHGSCVLIGMMYAMMLSKKKKLWEYSDLYIQDLKKTHLFALQSNPSAKDIEEISNFLLADKKNTSTKPRWILPSGFGKFAPDSNGNWTKEEEFDVEVFNSILDKSTNLYHNPK